MRVLRVGAAQLWSVRTERPVTSGARIVTLAASRYRVPARIDSADYDADAARIPDPVLFRAGGHRGEPHAGAQRLLHHAGQPIRLRAEQEGEGEVAADSLMSGRHDVGRVCPTGRRFAEAVGAAALQEDAERLDLGDRRPVRESEQIGVRVGPCDIDEEPQAEIPATAGGRTAGVEVVAGSVEHHAGPVVYASPHPTMLLGVTLHA